MLRPIATATVPSDYTSTSGTLTFNDGETSKQITIPIVDDSTPEGTENFKISLTNPSGGAVLGSFASATLSIQDNELPTLSISDVSQAEGNSGTTAFTSYGHVVQLNQQQRECQLRDYRRQRNSRL